MSTNTKIEWTDSTGSPWLGCTKVSEGCAHCYLPRQTPLRVHGIKLGAGQPRHRATSFRIGVIALNAKAQREGRRVRIFPSLCDWLDPEVPAEWLADFLDTIRLTPALDWQLLTKRPENFWSRMANVTNLGSSYRSGLDGFTRGWLNNEPPSNVWIGWTAENQVRADERMAHGLKIPARVRFVSVEPMLGPVRIDFSVRIKEESCTRSPIDWVICGGESGPGARPMHPDWARSLRDQCAVAKVPFFFKQWGEWIARSQYWNTDDSALASALVRCPESRSRVMRRDGTIDETLGTACMTNDADSAIYPLGKRAAGRLLDGRGHNELPEVRRA